MTTTTPWNRSVTTSDSRPPSTVYATTMVNEARSANSRLMSETTTITSPNARSCAAAHMTDVGTMMTTARSSTVRP